MSQPRARRNTRNKVNNNVEVEPPPAAAAIPAMYPMMPHPGMPAAAAMAMGHPHPGIHPYHPSHPPSAVSKNKKKGSKGSSGKTKKGYPKNDGANNDNDADDNPETMAQAKQRLLLKQIQDLKREKAVLVQENSTLKQQQQQREEETNDEADPHAFWVKEQELEGVREERRKLADQLEDAKDEIAALKEKVENRECEFDVLLQESLEDAERISQLQSEKEILQQQLGEEDDDDSDEEDEMDKKPKARVVKKAPAPARRSSTMALTPPNRRAMRATTVATVRTTRSGQKKTAAPAPYSKKRVATAKPTDSLPSPKRAKLAPSTALAAPRTTRSSASASKTSKKDKPTPTASATGTTKISSKPTQSKREMAHREKQALKTLRDFIVDECGGTKAMMEGFYAQGVKQSGGRLDFYYHYEDERHGSRRFRSKLEVMRFLGLDEEKDTATVSRSKKKGSSPRNLSTEARKTRSSSASPARRSSSRGRNH